MTDDSEQIVVGLVAVLVPSTQSPLRIAAERDDLQDLAGRLERLRRARGGSAGLRHQDAVARSVRPTERGKDDRCPSARTDSRHLDPTAQVLSPGVRDYVSTPP